MLMTNLFARTPSVLFPYLVACQLLFAQRIGFGDDARERSPRPIVIAHRGASGYTVEHTEAAKAIAFAQGADFLEQDVVLSKDGQFIVSHDITMEETTDVELRFPNRARSDGRYYFADFAWNEIKELEVHERTRRKSDDRVFPSRFPGAAGQRLLRLTDEIKLIRGWNHSTGRNTGLYVELKSPAFHKKEFGKSMGESLLPILSQEVNSKMPCYIQCFEADELIDLHDRLQCKWPLIFLMGKELSQSELAEVKRYATGIGPSIELLAVRGVDQRVTSTGLCENAHKLGLLVHAYTVRKDQLPKWSPSLDHTHSFLIQQLKVDGFFTDFPDLGVSATRNQ